MFALKAARDELNFAHHGLRIITTGSDHVKPRVMATSHEMLAGFSAQTKERYRPVMNCLTSEPSAQLDYLEVERALERLVLLRLVWRSTLGLYVLEDPTLTEAMRRAGMLEVVGRVSGAKLTLVTGGETRLIRCLERVSRLLQLA